MRIRIREIEETTKELACEEPSDELKELCGTGPVTDFKVRGPLSVALTHYRAGENLFFGGRIACKVVGICARCLEEFEFPLKDSISYVFAPRSEEIEESDSSEVEYY